MITAVKSQAKNEYLDMSGKKITVYILNQVLEQLNNLKNGDSIQIRVDNYEAIDNDLKAWSRITGNQLELLEGETDFRIYKIDKNQDPVANKRFAIILSYKGMEELLSPLGFAWAAAVCGMDVYMYLQGPAVRILKKGYREKLSGLNSIFSRFARKNLSAIGHIPPQEKIMALKELGATFYLCQPSMDHFKVKKSDLIFKEVIIAEYVTFLEVLKNAEIKFFL